MHFTSSFAFEKEQMGKWVSMSCCLITTHFLRILSCTLCGYESVGACRSNKQMKLILKRTWPNLRCVTDHARLCSLGLYIKESVK